ncbi:MAG: Hsp70 family protein [Archangium sp.]|nr:Hsp70 family protein [Archangium sp.]
MQAASEPVLGLDLGTTYSTAALVVNGKFHYAIDDRGEACIPSVVHFPRTGAPVVGAEADKLRVADPENTVWGIKRVIGRSLDSPQARRLQAGVVFKLVGHGADEVKVRVRTGDYAASEIAAILLRNLRERAQHRFGKSLTRAVVTVPVLTPRHVRDDMVRIGRMAGLEVLRVVAEPVAGALARGIAGAGDTGAPRLIFDFGGGTLDLTVVQHAANLVKVLATGGDDSLGGDDFDTQFSRYVANAVWGSHQLDVTRDAVLSDTIHRTCERVKRALSAAPSARYLIPEALGAKGRRWDIELPVTRQVMAPVWDELVGRAVDATRETIKASGIDPKSLSAVSLIGGTTFIPQVREAVSRAFGLPLDIENDPQTAVARGAAFLGAFPALIR